MKDSEDKKDKEVVIEKFLIFMLKEIVKMVNKIFKVIVIVIKEKSKILLSEEEMKKEEKKLIEELKYEEK